MQKHEKESKKEEEIIPLERFKNIKTGSELEGLISQIFKRGVESLLNAEMSEHHGYPNNGQRPEGSDNIRNGNSSNTLKSENGEMEILNYFRSFGLTE